MPRHQTLCSAMLSSTRIASVLFVALSNAITMPPNAISLALRPACRVFMCRASGLVLIREAPRWLRCGIHAIDRDRVLLDSTVDCSTHTEAHRIARWLYSRAHRAHNMRERIAATEERDNREHIARRHETVVAERASRDEEYTRLGAGCGGALHSDRHAELLRTRSELIRQPRPLQDGVVLWVVDPNRGGGAEGAVDGGNGEPTATGGPLQ